MQTYPTKIIDFRPKQKDNICLASAINQELKSFDRILDAVNKNELNKQDLLLIIVDRVSNLTKNLKNYDRCYPVNNAIYFKNKLNYANNIGENIVKILTETNKHHNFETYTLTLTSNMYNLKNMFNYIFEKLTDKLNLSLHNINSLYEPLLEYVKKSLLLFTKSGNYLLQTNEAENQKYFSYKPSI